MSISTPRKRKAIDVVFDPSTDDDTDEVEERRVIGEAIDWRDEEVIIGPTPQKHGRVLGLFDNLSPEYAVPDESGGVSKMKDADNAVLFDRSLPKRPAQKAKSPMKTPSFLRRQVISLDDEEGTKGPRLLFPAMPKRGLSTLINELREMEDNEEDEGMNVLREMETDFPCITHENEKGDARTEPEAEQLPVEKVKWQKKGLKRSHRRVIMRPSIKKKDGSASNTRQDDTDDDSDEYIRPEDEAADDLAALGETKDVTEQIEVAENIAGAHKKSSKSAKYPGGVSQNYKSLKLRNSGAKGGSRFGRGRFGGRR